MIRSALVVATDYYEDPGLAALRTPVHDAEALIEVLQDPAIGGFDATMFANQTARRLRGQLDRFFADRGRNDLLLLYISAHAIKDRDGNLFFAGSDTELERFAATAVPAEFINEQMASSRSRFVVLVLDCCYSGAFGRARSGGEGLDIGRRFSEGGRVVISASNRLEYAFEGTDVVRGDGVSSVFTHALVRGLRTGEADLDGDGVVTAEELYKFVHDEVGRTAPQQSPRYFAEGEGDIIVARNPRLAEVTTAGTTVWPRPDPMQNLGGGSSFGDRAIPYTSEPIVANDYWTVGDELDYTSYAEAIVEFLLHPETRPPLTIGIKGPWGSGKTSLMRMVQDRLDPATPGRRGASSSRQRVALTRDSRKMLAGIRSRRSRHTSVTDGVTNAMLLRRLREKARRPSQLMGLTSDDSVPNGLRAEPRGGPEWRPTVWFNPWMYQSGEQIWAGLAHEVISQVTRRLSVSEREAFWLELNLRRVDGDAIRRRLHLALLVRLVPAALLFALTALSTTVLLILGALFPSITDMLGVTARALVASGTAGILLIGLVRGLGFWQERVSASLNTLVSEPDYAKGWREHVESGTSTLSGTVHDPDHQSKLGYLYLVQTDMRRVLELVATTERPIVVFVDDLDRCSPGAVAQVIEAINLFLAGEFPDCIFVVAMEPEVVAAHIEVAYADLVSTMSGADHWGDTHHLGWRFLDKVIQLPISLPLLQAEQAGRFLASTLVGMTSRTSTGPSVDAEKTAQLEEDIRRQRPSIGRIADAAVAAQSRLTDTNVDLDGLSPEARTAMRRELKRRLHPDDPEVQTVISAVAGRLTRNPREIKRFVNVFRFFTVIRQERESAGLPVPDQLTAIAKLAVISVRWPQLRGALGRQIGPTERDTVLSLLEAPVAELGENASWSQRKAALHAVLAGAEIPDSLKAELLSSEDLCTLLASDPPIGTAAAGYL